MCCAGGLQSMGSRTRLSNFTFTFHFHVLEKEMATHSSVLAWRIPGTGETGGLPSLGLHRVGHDWSDFAAAAVLCLVAQSCLILCNPMDCSPSGSSVHGDSPGKNTGVGCCALLLQEIVPTEGSNPGLPHCKQVLYCLSHQGSQRILECIAYAFSRGSSWPRNQTWDYCIAGRFFTSWAGKATRELPGRSIKIDIGFNKNILSVHKATIIIMNLRGDTDMVRNKTQWTLLKTLEYMYKTVFSSVAQLCSTICDPMDCSTPGFPVHHQLLELAQTHVHWVSDAIQPSYPPSSPSPAALNLSQHQDLFQWDSFFWIR